uniref:NADH-ubiquinone oxidoreductase 21kDa subunit N-terminal domain-containing protein n=1 Tax=Spumella elongata TaxID=89044 RepID=A0A7S3H0Q3_9STRA
MLKTFAKKMPVTSIPKFPVVDPSPKLDKTLANLSLIDFTKIGAFSTAGYVFGWFSARKPFRGQQSKFLAGVGLFAGFTYATLSSAQRFMGLEANASEVQRYGVMSADEVARRTEQMNTPNLVLIDSAANHDD